MNRFTRQMRLVDVGEAGQAKLSAAELALRTHGFARTVEEAYLRAAGVGVELVPSGVGVGSSSTRLELAPSGVGVGSSSTRLELAPSGIGVPSSTTRGEICARRDEHPARAHDEHDSRSPNAGKGSCDHGQNPGMGECDLARSISGGERHRAEVGLGLRHAAARDVADGAYAALVAMREVLGVEPAAGTPRGTS